jgi:plasmid stabilization system protein ParE
MSIAYAASARADLDDIEDNLMRIGPHVLVLFHRRLARALNLFERFPFAAEEYEPADPRFPGMRYFVIRRFESYAVFYEPISNGIRVLRVLHSSRNFTTIFIPPSDPPPPPDSSESPP